MIRIGLATPLFLVFLVLKLTGTIDWSWWGVTAPLWAPLAVLFILWAVVKVVVGVGLAICDVFDRRKARS